ncbi:hypothetical protein GCM10010411_78140 [Actinomadura fulvescens]|uniref:Uncharacterized protein n=1 Tax=Actinomadura fulvescens TaxID=46160 RepID=A0ABP6CV04_9ACTN
MTPEEVASRLDTRWPEWSVAYGQHSRVQAASWRARGMPCSPVNTPQADAYPELARQEVTTVTWNVETFVPDARRSSARRLRRAKESRCTTS